MTERPEAPPEGALLKRALVAMRISQREAARRSGISETRWRQLVSGYQVVSREKVPVRSPDDTLARMARAVGVTAEQLEEAGRGGAATALRDAEAGAAAAPAGPGADAGSRPRQPGGRAVAAGAGRPAAGAARADHVRVRHPRRPDHRVRGQARRGRERRADAVGSAGPRLGARAGRRTPHARTPSRTPAAASHRPRPPGRARGVTPAGAGLRRPSSGTGGTRPGGGGSRRGTGREGCRGW